MNKTTVPPSLVRRLLGALVLSVGLPSLHAQQTEAADQAATPPASDAAQPALSATQDAGATDDEVVVLTPFVVDASQDKGYLVANTLSGTRVRTDLSDVGSSVSVMNSEFLKDIGARDLQDALRYEVNTENENEVVYNDTEGTINSDGLSNRIRGLVSGQVTRDFFNTSIVTDNYNTDRLTISRGPNAVLFGIGSPSGSFDATLKRASSQRISGAASATFDQYGTQRYEIDYNQPLTDWWAMRVDVLHQDKRSSMEPEYDKGDRQFLTTTLRPLTGMAITGSYENITNDRVHARRHTLYDGVSDWIAAGKPLYDVFTGTWTTAGGAATSFAGTTIGNSQRTYSFSNSIAVPSSAWSGITLNPADQALVAQGNQALFSKGSMARSYSGASQDLLGFNNEKLFSSSNNFSGLANQAQIDASILNLRLEQQIGDNLALELAYNREDFQNQSDEFLRGNFAILQADVNKYLTLHDSAGNLLRDSSGALVQILNPNAGRYMITNNEDIGSGSIGFDRGWIVDSYRATLSYDLDLTGRSKWFGRHQIAAMYQRDDYDSHVVKTRTKNIGDEIMVSLLDGANNINHVAYVDLPGDSDGSGVRLPSAWKSPADNDLTWWDTVTGSLQEPAIHTVTQNDAALGVVNSRFADLLGNDSLVFILGFRRDRQRVYEAPITASDIDFETGESLWEDIPVPDTPTLDESGKTYTFSTVYHTPWKGLGVHYSYSDNFTPQSKYRDFEGRPQTASEGSSNEIGLSWTSADRKFFGKLTYFDAKALNQKEEDWFFWEPAWMAIWYMEYQIKDYVLSIYPGRGLDRTEDLDPDFDPYTQSDREVPFRDRESTGWELELIAQPLPNLDLRFTAAKTEAVDSHIAADMIAFAERRMPVWERYADLTASWNRSWSSDPYYDDPRNLYWGDDNPGRANLYSLGYTPYNYAGGIARLEDLKAMEGARTLRSRATTMNLTADYTFTQGSLRGFKAGGGLRYRDKASIGYLGKVSDNPALPAGTRVSDLTKPVYGDEILGLDLWVGYTHEFRIGERKVYWSINLYAWNVNTGEGVEPGAVNFDGEVTRWIIRDPRTISLSNSFSF